MAVAAGWYIKDLTELTISSILKCQTDHDDDVLQSFDIFQSPNDRIACRNTSAAEILFLCPDADVILTWLSCIKMSDGDDIPLEQGDVWPAAEPGLHPGPALDNYKATNFPVTHRHLNPPTLGTQSSVSWTRMSPRPGMRCPAS